MQPRSINAAVFLASMILVALQVTLMQALAEAQGHHFAYAVISLALLGFGSSGTTLALFRAWAMARADRLLPRLLLLAGIACVVALPLASRAAAHADFPLLFVDWRAWGPLLLSASLAFIPFFLGALFLGLAFMLDTPAIGRLYAANLLGSAAGALMGLVLLFRLSAAQIFPLSGCVLACAAWAASRKFSRSAACLTVFLLGVAATALMPHMPVSAYKAISYAMRLPGAEVMTDERHPMGRLQVVQAPALRHAPGLSLHFAGELPATGHEYVNGEDYGAFLPPAESGEHILDHGVQALPLALAAPRRALVLHAGAGGAVGQLLSHPGIAVDAVEPHPVAAKLLLTTYPDPEGRLSVTAMNGRAFLGQSSQRYDLILLPPQGAFGGGIGLQALQENHLLTREGFSALWNALSRNDNQAGLLSFCVHLDQPPRQSLRLLSLLATAMRQAGIKDLSMHVAAVRSWEMLAVVASTHPFTATARQRLEEFAGTGGFDRVWIPGHGPAEEDRYHLMLDDILPEAFEAILIGEEAAFVWDYPFDITAPKDSRPYFHQFIRWERLADVRQRFGLDNLAFVEMGSILVALTVAILTVAASILILLPLLTAKRAGLEKNDTPTVLVYFGAIGLGFMFLEIVWIQRLTLFWGQPLYSAAGVLAALMCGMGLGSMLSARLPSSPQAIRGVLAGVLGLLAVLSILMPWVMTMGLGWSEPLKWVTGLALLFVPAVFLGMPFPLALCAVRPHMVPWAWGVNGCMSVLAAPLAVLLAMQAGFGAVNAVAATAYLVAMCSSSLAGGTRHSSL